MPFQQMIITNDPNGRSPGGRLRVGIPGRHQFGIAAGFRLECMAGFVGIRKGGGSNLCRSCFAISGQDESYQIFANRIYTVLASTNLIEQTGC